MSNVVQLPDKDKKERREPSFCPAPEPSHAYAELAVTTNFSFLRGASPPKEFILQAIALGLTGIGIADRNSVAGVVRAYSALEEMNEHIASEQEKGIELPTSEARRRRAACASPTARPTSSPIRRTAPLGAA